MNNSKLCIVVGSSQKTNKTVWKTSKTQVRNFGFNDIVFVVEYFSHGYIKLYTTFYTWLEGISKHYI